MDLNEIDYCEHCGVLYNSEIVCANISPLDTGYLTNNYVGKCPVCKKEVYDER